jgi:hypothetical protein
LFFQVFEHAGQQLLSRVWLFDPGETQVNAAATAAATQSDKEPWNGEFYVSYGGNPARVWEEARKFGFISAGGGSWYSKTLKMLSPGDRVWVKIPKTGYVGVGRVVEAAQAAKDFKVTTAEGPRPVFDALRHGAEWRALADDAEKSEYFVRVDWTKTVNERDAFNELGLFGNQNSVCQPTTPKWRHTVDRLKALFGIAAD